MHQYYNLKQTLLLVFALLFLLNHVNGQSRGFIQEENIKVANITTDAQINGLTVNQKQVTRTYYDGLGRTVQTVALNASPQQNDLIQPVAYDNGGRVSTSYLAYAGKSTDVTGSYRAGAISTDQPAFYNNTSQNLVATDNSPFTQQVMENSPLQRLLASGRIGAGFQPSAGQHYKSIAYRPNNSTKDGNIWVWTADGTYTAGNYFADNALAVTDVKDEDNVETLTYVDFAGRLILKRQVLTGGNLDTYYCYNNAGMISFIIPPKAITMMVVNNNFSLAQTGVSKLVFHYLYDSMGRVVEKTVPAKGTMYIVYDPLNRPVLMQDARMMANNQWNYLKYDVKGHTVSQGIYTDNTTSPTSHIGRVNMQAYVNTLNYSTTWYESRTSTLTNGGYYTNSVFPTAATGTLNALAYVYYDDYDINGDGAVDFNYSAQGLANEGTATSAQLKGVPTMVSKTTIGAGLSNTWLTSVTFYDKRGTPIQTKSNNQIYYTNATTLTDIKTIVPDFSGVSQVIKVSKQTGASVTTTVLTTLGYDHMYRLNTVSQQYNNSGITTQVAAYAYNEIGQIISKNLGLLSGTTIPSTLNLNTTYSGTNAVVASSSITMSQNFSVPSGSTFSASIATNYLQTVDYRYNIRGQLLNINNSKLSNDGGVTNNDSNDLFGMQFSYEQADANLGNTPYFNGKLAAVKWMSKDGAGTSSYERAFTFSYDGVDRYKGETYAERPTTSTVNFTITHGWDESGITYDPNGNILTLNRYSSSQGAGTSVQIDNLNYTYDPVNPNQLQNISDGTDATHTGAGFRNLTGSTGNYVYDGTNGNLVADPYKGITSIGYNVINKTDKVSISATQYINYTYDANGSLIRKQAYKSGSATQITDYVDGFVYNNSSGAEILAYFPMPEGRVRNDGGTLHQEFIITDMQGNARISFQDDGTGKAVVRQENSYYGFGLIMTNSPVGTLGDGNKQLYNGGAEWQNDYGNLPDYYQTFYRNYDAAIGRFIGVDPIAEGSESMSSYQYANNNPIEYNDPMGDQPPQRGYDSILIKEGGAGSSYASKIKAIDGSGGAGSKGSGPVTIQYLYNIFLNTPAGHYEGAALSLILPLGGRYFVDGTNTVRDYTRKEATDKGVTYYYNVGTLTPDFKPADGHTFWVPGVEEHSYFVPNSQNSSNPDDQEGGFNEATIAKTFLTGDMQTLPYSMSDKARTIDCSRCTMQIAAKAGYNIPRTAYDQAKWYQKNGFWSTNLNDAKPGDHMFWLRGQNQYHTGVVSNMSAAGIISVVQANVNDYLAPSIHQFNLQPDGTMRGFGQPFVGLGRYKP